MCQINNIILTTTILKPNGNTFHINLEDTCNKLFNCFYVNNHFKRINFNLRNPKSIVHLYSTGKLVCLGARSVSEGKISLRRVARKIQKVSEFPLKIIKIEVRNIAASMDLKCGLNLRELHDFLQEFNDIKVRYDLKIFANLRINFREWNGNIKMGVSRSGKLILTGMVSDENIDELFDTFVNRIKPFLNVLH